ncbi:MAG: hypothetical protein LKJ44_03240 [Bifidobacteriaceae bacterium]|jgi:hypothetical protein|nr:hypothetical protein [Bifidobacteriaceae bacterium]MCI1978714.1 hypothetical protein [Bifidobacteriaceae bacterium]
MSDSQLHTDTSEQTTRTDETHSTAENVDAASAQSAETQRHLHAAAAGKDAGSSDGSEFSQDSSRDSSQESLQDSEMAAVEVRDAIESLQTPHHAVSLAEQKRKHRHPGAWVVTILVILVAMIVPYWFGRDFSINHTDTVLKVLRTFDPRGLALISWVVVVIIFASVGLAINGWLRKLWILVAILSFSAEQFLAGLSLLKSNFWYSTYVVFHAHAVYANAINLGIIAAVAGLVVFAVVFVAILVLIKRTSPLNVLTRAGSALSCFLIIELAALFIVLFGGIITIV